MAEALIGNLRAQLKYLQNVSKDRLNHRNPPNFKSGRTQTLKEYFGSEKQGGLLCRYRSQTKECGGRFKGLRLIPKALQYSGM